MGRVDLLDPLEMGLERLPWVLCCRAGKEDGELHLEEQKGEDLQSVYLVPLIGVACED